MGTTAFITPEIVRWARRKAGFSVSALASSLKRKPEEIESWEEGSGRPTIRQAENLAKRLRIPFGYLYLSQPPEEPTPIADFRRMPDSEKEMSPDLRDVLYGAMRKQEWYRAFLEDEGADETIPLVGKFSQESSVEVVASYLRGALRVDSEVVPNTRTSSGDLLLALTRQLESIGIIVLRSGVVGNNNHRPLSVKEFRGFTLCDPIAPLIFVNAKDSSAGKVFTLMHELAHLAIGESGISNEPLGPVQGDGIEAFCNSVAAETLVPREDFLRRWERDLPAERNVERLRLEYRVSTFVLLIRAITLKRISQTQFSDLWRKAEDAVTEPTPGGNFATTLPARHSPIIIDAIVGATKNGKLTFRSGAELLSVRMKTFSSLLKGVNA